MGLNIPLFSGYPLLPFPWLSTLLPLFILGLKRVMRKWSFVAVTQKVPPFFFNSELRPMRGDVCSCIQTINHCSVLCLDHIPPVLIISLAFYINFHLNLIFVFFFFYPNENNS